MCKLPPSLHAQKMDFARAEGTFLGEFARSENSNLHEHQHLITDDNHKTFLKDQVKINFRVIYAEYPKKWFNKKGIDPDSNHPKKTVE
jgi:hypothetical protein